MHFTRRGIIASLVAAISPKLPAQSGAYSSRLVHEHKWQSTQFLLFPQYSMSVYPDAAICMSTTGSGQVVCPIGHLQFYQYVPVEICTVPGCGILRAKIPGVYQEEPK